MSSKYATISSYLTPYGFNLAASLSARLGLYALTNTVSKEASATYVAQVPLI